MDALRGLVEDAARVCVRVCWLAPLKEHIGVMWGHTGSDGKFRDMYINVYIYVYVDVYVCISPSLCTYRCVCIYVYM